MPFWRRAQLTPPNVPPDWTRADTWLRWPSPRNVVVGESNYLPALRELAGPPCEEGYCLPAEVKLVREPSNPYDANAIRAEVGGQVIGYLTRHIAAQLTPELDRARCRSFGVCGVIRGGSYEAPNLGVHVWLDMLTTPGPEITLTDDFAEVSWPPRDEEVFPAPQPHGR